MRKLKLDLDTLNVESFVAGHGAAQAGTVRGRIDPFYPQVPETLDLCDVGTTVGPGSVYTYTCGAYPTNCGCAPTWRDTCWKPTCAGNTCLGTCQDFRCTAECPP